MQLINALLNLSDSKKARNYILIYFCQITYLLYVLWQCFFSLEVPSSLGGGRMDGESTKRKSLILKTGVCPVWVTLVLSAKQR